MILVDVRVILGLILSRVGFLQSALRLILFLELFISLTLFSSVEVRTIDQFRILSCR